MIKSRVRAYGGRIRSELVAALEGNATPQEVAASFAVGVFVTALPTLGAGIGVLAAVAYFFKRASGLALFASVIVLNPIAKWGVYGVSFSLGVFMLGPVPGANISSPSIMAGSEIAARLIAGNLVVAVVFAVIGYAGALLFARRFHRRSDAIVPEEEPAAEPGASSEVGTTSD